MLDPENSEHSVKCRKKKLEVVEEDKKLGLQSNVSGLREPNDSDSWCFEARLRDQ